MVEDDKALVESWWINLYDSIEPLEKPLSKKDKVRLSVQMQNERYYRENKDKIRKINKKYYEKNKDKMLKQQKVWREKKKAEKMMEDVKRLRKTGTPFCVRCKKDYKKVSGYEWLPDCECYKKGLRLFKG